MKRAYPLRQIESAETAFGATGKIRSEDSDDHFRRAIFLRTRNADYRASEAIVRMENGQPLQLARALIARGKIAEAEQCLARVQSEQLDQDECIELELQTARAFANQGQWNEAAMACTRVLGTHGASMLTRSAACQVRANAWFETRHFDRAYQDLEMLATYSELLPYGQVSFYGKMARIRCLARLQGEASARAEFEKFVRAWSKNLASANLDELLSMLRVDLDLRRFTGREHAECARATIAVSERVGDETYAGLGWLDYWAALPPAARLEVEPYLSLYLDTQPRVRALYDEVRSGVTCPLETALRLREYAAKPRTDGEGASFRSPTGVDTILGLKSWIRIDLVDRKFEALRIQPRMKSVLSAIAEKPASKEELFRRVWGMSRFDSIRHDSIVRTAVARAREQAGIETVSEDGRISLHPRIAALPF